MGSSALPLLAVDGAATVSAESAGPGQRFAAGQALSIALGFIRGGDQATIVPLLQGRHHACLAVESLI